MRQRLPILFGILIGLALAAAPILASDADLQNYGGVSTWGADPQALNILLPTDGKKITADSNTTGKAPVNRGTKQLKDFVNAIHDGIFGSRSGAQLRTVKALYADGTGGAGHAKTAGTITASVNLEAETGQAKTRTGFLSDSNGSGTATLNHTRVVFTDTAASGTNPTAVTGLTNELRAVLIPKLWGTVSFNGLGTVSTDDGANLFLPALTGGKLRITPTSTFANALYTVAVSCVIGTTPTAAAVALTDKATNRFDITIAGSDPNTNAGTCDIIVMARQTTP